MSVTQPHLRIVSLLPSATEILCRLGLEENIVGISHECDFPASIKNRPTLTGPKLDPHQRGSQIHADLQSLIQKSLSIYDVNVELLKNLKPDLIVTQDQCRVCAIATEDLEKALCKTLSPQTQICTLSPHTLDDIHRDFNRIGKTTQTETAAKDLITEFWIQLNSINSKVGTSLPSHPRVLCLEWLEPLMVAGGWIPEIVKIAGGQPLIVSEPEKFRTLSWEEIETANPDMVVIFPCGYPIEKTLHELKTSSELKKLALLKAYQNEKVFVCDGNQYFNRPGPRITDSCRILASLFHPDKFKETPDATIKIGSNFFT
jgi:iron complex transport system substrate-binding protein